MNGRFEYFVCFQGFLLRVLDEIFVSTVFLRLLVDRDDSGLTDSNFLIRQHWRRHPISASCVRVVRSREGAVVFAVCVAIVTAIYNILGMSCTECHAAKVKCDKVFPCSRCVRLGKADTCRPHVSRQGQRKKQTSSSSSSSSLISSPPPPPPPTSAIVQSEADALQTEISLSSSVANSSQHYGIQYLVRSWMSIAFRRRSMALLSRAAEMAQKCGISMDQLLCEHPEQRGMDFLYPILLTPTHEQLPLGTTPLQHKDIPQALLDATKCPYEHDTFARRWIWIREMHKGQSRFYLTPGFDQEVCSQQRVESTYRSNQGAVVDLFLVNSRSQHIRALAHQISSHQIPNQPLQANRTTGVQLQTVFSNEPRPVDQIACVAILSLDHAFLYTEYIPTDVPNFEFDMECLELDGFHDDEEMDFVLDLLG